MSARYARMTGALIAVAAVALLVTVTRAADWPLWGGGASRNMVSSEKSLPNAFATEPGSKNLLWKARLGLCAYGSPVVAGGKVFVGATNRGTYDPKRPMWGGALLAFDEKSGRFLWQLVIPQPPTDGRPSNLGKYCYGVSSTPAVEGDRLYFVSSKDELLCLDTNGLANGNNGPFKGESRYMSDRFHPPIPLRRTDADIIWRLDMIGNRDIDACPQDSANCSVLILGDYVYVSPSNGTEKRYGRIPRPNAPSLIVVDKKTGRLVARDRTGAASRVFHGEWSSPSTGRIGGRDLIFYGAGNGICYAFDSAPLPAKRGQHIGSLKTVWRFDVNSAAGRKGSYADAAGPSEIIATPVFYKNRVYVSTGQDPTHGKGFGALACIDAAKTGDITKSGKVWLFKSIGRSLSTVAISDDLVYAADNSGVVYCLDADTGKLYWKQDTRRGILSSVLVADAKVYIGTDRGELWVLATGKKRKVINIIDLGSPIAATPAAANGTLFVSAQGCLFAARRNP